MSKDYRTSYLQRKKLHSIKRSLTSHEAITLYFTLMIIILISIGFITYNY